MSRVVLVTGVSRDIAARVARSLASDDLAVVGIDAIPPKHDLGGARYVRSDLRSPLLSRTLAEIAPDVVVHAALSDELSGTAGKEVNVLGAMQLLAACQTLPGLQQLVAVSSSAIYGAAATEPSRLDEDNVPAGRRSGLGRDAAELEDYLSAFAARRPDVGTTVLRFAELLGAGVESRFARYISLPVVPKPAGFDARMQFLHPVDAVDACREVVARSITGVFNVAAADVLPLTQVLRIMGRPSIGVPPPITPALIEFGRRRGVVAQNVRFGRGELREVTYGRAMDVSRFAAHGFQAHYSSRRAVQEFAALGTPGLFSPGRIEEVTNVAGRIGRAIRRTGKDDRG